jgi:hypothetical protein
LKDEKLRKATLEVNSAKMRELTFKPNICKRSTSILKKIVSEFALMIF